MRIDNTDAIDCNKPNFAIRRFAQLRRSSGGGSRCSYPVTGVKRRGLHFVLGIAGPSIQLGAGDTYQAASHIKPDEMIIIFHGPVNCVAGKAVLTSQRSDVPVFDSTQTSFRRSPQRSAQSESKIVDNARAQTVGRRV